MIGEILLSLGPGFRRVPFQVVAILSWLVKSLHFNLSGYFEPYAISEADEDGIMDYHAMFHGTGT